MRPITTAVFFGGLLFPLPVRAQDSGLKGPDANPSKMTADPQAPGPLTVVPPPVHGPSYGEGTTDEFTFSYHGYLSAPFLVSLGQKQQGVDTPNKSSTPLHSLTLALPDYTYNTWFVTNQEPGAWASMNFSIGTSQVFGSVYMGGWDFSQGQQTPQGAAHAQLALSSFMPSLTFRLDNVFHSKTRIDAVVGGTRDRYGGSGKWDYGAYGAAVIGAVVAIGETVGIERPFGDYALRFEEGFGGNGHPATDPRATTLVAHTHLIGTYKSDVLRVGLHFLTSWTQDERAGKPPSPFPVATLQPGDPDGSISVTGADMRFNGGIFGELFLGTSYVKITHAEHVDGSLQVAHVAGGQAMMDNFLGEKIDNGIVNNNPGTGSLQNVLVQYDYSFGTLARYPEAFWGNGSDIKVQLFSLYTKVHSADPIWDGQDKLKFGGKFIYSPLEWLAAAVRFDRVIPNLNVDDNLDPTVHSPKQPGQNFSALSTRLTLRTSFVAHETVDFQWSHYFYPTTGKLGVMQTPKQDLIFTNPEYARYGQRPFDSDVFSINGTMWF
jgi:hypothetical protein